MNVRDRDRVELAARVVAAQDTAGVFPGDSEPVSSWVQEIFEPAPRQSPRLVTKLYTPPRPLWSPGYQFWIVEYLISASSSAMSSTTAACSWFSSREGAVQPSR